jgi:hypothetical protein
MYDHRFDPEYEPPVRPVDPAAGEPGDDYTWQNKYPKYISSKYEALYFAKEHKDVHKK